MNGTPVELSDMLLCREHRATIQNTLLSKHHCSLLSFCMNIPGPIKTNKQIRAAFEQGLSCLEASITSQSLPVRERILIHENTGDECILAVDAPAETLKLLTVSIEETHPLGRLFDMDVLDHHGNKLSRASYRKCLLCGKQAQECARSRIHSVADMQQYICMLLDNFETTDVKKDH